MWRAPGERRWYRVPSIGAARQLSVHTNGGACETLGGTREAEPRFIDELRVWIYGRCAEFHAA